MVLEQTTKKSEHKLNYKKFIECDTNSLIEDILAFFEGELSENRRRNMLHSMNEVFIFISDDDKWQTTLYTLRVEERFKEAKYIVEVFNNKDYVSGNRYECTLLNLTFSSSQAPRQALFEALSIIIPKLKKIVEKS